MSIDFDKVAVVEHLRGLIDGRIEPKHWHLGVCQDLNAVFGLTVGTLVQDFYRPHLSEFKWYSGNTCYPIAHDSMSGLEAYHEYHNLWDAFTVYGRRRFEFCEWLADLIEESIVEKDGFGDEGAVLRVPSLAGALSFASPERDDVKEANEGLLKKVYTHLMGLGKGEIEPKNNASGLCSELYKTFNLSYSFICGRDSSEFELYSGMKEYPIGFLSEYESSNEDDWWDSSTDFGSARRLYCLWLAEDIKKKNFVWCE